MTTSQELYVRRQAARHLSGIPAIQNRSAIDHLETLLCLEEIHARFGAEEIERCNALADAEGIAA